MNDLNQTRNQLCTCPHGSTPHTIHRAFTMDAAADVVPSVETPIVTNEDPATPKPALTPPTSEDMDKRERERLSSELSELDSDDDEEIEPDHYFDGGKIPVFKPTMDQFRSFKKYVDKIDKYGMKSGIVKIIPPIEWRDGLPDLSDKIKTIKVKNPITQEFAGQHGIYTQANIEKQRSYTLPEWKSLTLEPHHQPPAKRGERRKAAAEAPTRTRSTRTQASTQPADTEAASTSRRGPGRPRRRAARKDAKDEVEPEAEAVEVPPTPTSPGREEEKKTPAKRIKKEDQEETMPTKPRGRQPRSTASRRVNNRTDTSGWVDEEQFKNFDYHLENVDDYTIERCKELEENYWRTINYGQPMYGADMPGSLFDDRTTSWNVAKLENLLDVLGTKVPGVNTAYLYLGMWKATFAWHLEDVDLYSINYIHFGAPKQWYSISQEDARRFEAAMKSIWPREAKNCSQFLRHKTFLISPSQLEKQFNIKVNRLVHYEGEFVITYPYGYHSGYNIGYNCAESVNFANYSWLNYGRIAKKCECEADSVWVDVNEIERKLRGEPTPEYYEETDSEGEDDGADHLPSPPPSVKGKARGKPGRKPANNKRKRGEEEASKPKKRIRLRLKVPGKEMPCILCPNDVEYDDLLSTDNGLKAHRLCGDYTPETYVSSPPSERVCNVAGIGKDRLELKCNYCRSKRGAVFQCSSKKCTRAFHATCAFAAGVQVDYGPMQTFGDEGVEYVYDGYDFRCRWHRPKKRNAKTVDSETLEKDKFVFRYAKTLKPKDVIQFQYLGTDQVYGGMVVENRPGECTVLVDVLPDGDRVEVEWKYLLALDPAESLRPKPSSNAQPLPEHIKDNDSSLSITNRTDGVPSMGDPFHDPNSTQKWAEFRTAEEVTQKSAMVDFSKENRLWFYLGKTSTEARPQYTEDPTQPRHNVKANFLDTVKPAPTPMGSIDRRSFPAAFPIKPSPAPLPKTPIQPYVRPADRPYQYKPRIETAYKSPVYNYSPDSRKNPNSPVAHQPNVVYDYRATAPQYGYALSGNGYHRQPQTYHNHTAPAPPGSSGWKQPSAPGPLLNGIDQYARSGQPLPPYPYYQAGPHGPNQQLPPFPYSPQDPRPAHGPPAQHASASQPQPSLCSAAPISSMLSNTAGTTKPPIPDGGYTAEWMPKHLNGNSSQASSRPQSSHGSAQGLGLSFGNGIAPLPAPRPMPQFQTADAFQRDVARAPQQPMGISKWEQMVKQLSSTGPQAPSGTTKKPANPILPRPPNMPQEPPRGGRLMSPLAAPPPKESKPKPAPLPFPLEPQRPIPSPLSEASKSPKRPEYSPISDDGGTGPAPRPTLPPLGQIHSGETWRYS
ncbi:hypothetical protein BCR34DRAFT_378608 [Clohesyomyces aquaticus]|uniref:[histone H3]-trimethyl-L-lysine(9) demethylase n=1 Tax=Clohesyomyces aquaticus TaxID=1231657 RepID=A0A1Y2A664_9PLEO|nr:hypothetical protein BCR34DRAFT_378608 [Clohesyomyces aquaticus]